MRNVIRISIAVLGLSLFGTSAMADVARVVVVDTDDVAAYAAELDKGEKILKDAGATSEIRRWLATSAGPNTGQVIVAIIYEDMMHLAKEMEMLQGHEKFEAWLKGLDEIRTITSDSLYREL